MSESGTIPEPGAEHAYLMRKVGTWDVECEYFFDPSADPIRAKGVDTVRALGSYWVVAEAEFTLPMLTIQGQAVSGFDPVAKIFRSTWVDSATPYLYSFEGLYDTERELLELVGFGVDPQSRREVRYRSKEMYGSPDDRIFELLVEATPGMETQVLRYQYTRRK